MCLLTLLSLSMSTLTYASTPDQQLAFANQLMEEGDEVFAMLEFKRFLFESPKHAKAPDAMYGIAQIQLSYMQNIVGAKVTLRKIVTHYSETAMARKAKAFVDYIEINSDFSGKPLFAMLAARSYKKTGNYSDAVTQYKHIISGYPKAKLAPDAAHDLAVLQLRNYKKPNDARTTLNWVISNHPKHAIMPECELLLAEVLEAERGPTQDVISAYRAVAKKYPTHSVAKTATIKASALEKLAYAVKRQFAKEFIRNYVVKKVVEPTGQSTQYVVEIEVPTDCSDREVKATLEDALIKEGEKRKTPAHRVAIKSFFSYPLTEAGEVTWTPGQIPTYVIPVRENEDVLKDAFFDLFRRQRGVR